MPSYEVWDFGKDERMMTFADQATALLYLRGLLGAAPAGRINSLGLVTTGAQVLTYPSEGAALLAQVFGLEADE